MIIKPDNTMNRIEEILVNKAEKIPAGVLMAGCGAASIAALCCGCALAADGNVMGLALGGIAAMNADNGLQLWKETNANNPKLLSDIHKSIKNVYERAVSKVRER